MYFGWNLNYCGSYTHEILFFWRCSHIRKELIYFERAAINMTFYALKPKRLFRRSRLCTLEGMNLLRSSRNAVFITRKGKLIRDILNFDFFKVKIVKFQNFN